MEQLAVLQWQLGTVGSITFAVKVRPSAQRTRIKGVLADGTFKIDVAAAPEDGKANAELADFLAGEFGVTRGDVELVSGQTSPRKVIRISR